MKTDTNIRLTYPKRNKINYPMTVGDDATPVLEKKNTNQTKSAGIRPPKAFIL